MLEGTIVGPDDDEFDCDAAVEALCAAFQDISTDDKAITDVMVTHTNEQRQAIKKAFRLKHEKNENLREVITQEFGGHFLEATLALLQAPLTFDAHCIRRHIKRKRMADSCLVDLFLLREWDEREAIIDAYYQGYGQALATDIQFCGDFHPHLLELLNAKRPIHQNDIDLDLAQKDADLLFKAGVDILASDLTVFNGIICQRHFAQIQAAFAEYEKLCRRNIESSFHLRGDFKDALVRIVQLIKNPAQAYAVQLGRALGEDDVSKNNIDDEEIIRILVTRSEIDLDSIKNFYAKRFHRPLTQSIRDVTHGEYAHLLIKIVDPNGPPP